MKIIDYIIVKLPDNELVNEVNKRITNGWIPLGGAQLLNIEGNALGQMEIVYSQTMVKYGE